VFATAFAHPRCWWQFLLQDDVHVMFLQHPLLPMMAAVGYLHILYAAGLLPGCWQS
jgi:hypothetical protein